MMEPHLSTGYVAEAWHAHILVLGLLPQTSLPLSDIRISEVAFLDRSSSLPALTQSTQSLVHNHALGNRFLSN